MEKKSIQRKPDQDIIWHFTQIETLPKILSSTGGGLLSSHIRFLEDDSDGEICRSIAEEAGELLFYLINKTKVGNNEQAIARIRQLSNLGIKLSMFVSCFCKEIESPFMWRVYTRAGGCAIGFQKNKLIDNLIRSPSTFINSGDCRYTENIEKEKQVFDEVKKNTLGLLYARLAFRAENDSEEKAWADNLIALHQLALEAALVKKRFFQDEKEFRIVQSPLLPDGLKELSWIDGKPRLPLKTKIPIAEMVEEIVVSPLVNMKQNLNTALLVAEAAGLDCRNIRVFSPS